MKTFHLFLIAILGLCSAINGTAQLVSYGATTGCAPAPVASASLMAQSAAVSSVTSYTVPSAGPFNYVVYANLNIVSVATDVITVQIAYTDENGVAQTATLSSSGTSPASSFSGTGAKVLIPCPLHCAAASSITVKTVLTTSSGSISYDLSSAIIPAW